VSNILIRRAGVLLAVGATTLLVAALPAAAHVTISPTSVPQGSDATLTFNVPNEKDNATTTKVVVAMPEGQPIASVAVAAVPGWTVQVTKAKLAKPVQSDEGPVTEAVSRVTWTATPAAAIKPGQFAQFSISAGPMPSVDQVLFKTLQTYSDGTVVRWIQAQTGSQEPANPAPALALSPATGDAAASPSPSVSPSSASGSAAATPPADQATSAAASDDTSRGLAIAALVAGVVAFLLALGALVLAVRRRAPSRDISG
jgi:uncharacterized protein